jgi:hypothetical protein
VAPDGHGRVFRPQDTVRFLDDKYAQSGTAKVINVKPRTDFRIATASPSDLSQFKNQTGAKYFELTFDSKVVAKPGWLLSDADAISNGWQSASVRFARRYSFAKAISSPLLLLTWHSSNG